MKNRWFRVGVAALLIAALIIGYGLQLEFMPSSNAANQAAAITVGDQVVARVTLGTVEAAGTVDYVLDGTADNVQFQLALNALPLTGGILNMVSTGTIDFDAAVTRAIPNVVIMGAGLGSAFTLDGINAPFIAGGNGWQFINCTFDVAPNMGATTGWSWSNVVAAGVNYDSRNPSYSVVGGTITGNLTGNVSGSAGSAGTAVTATNVSGGTASVTSLTDSGLTSGRIPVAGAGGLLGDDTGLTYNSGTDTLTTTNLTAPTGRTATYVIAASDATAQEKAQADVVCDGTADEVEINAAITAIGKGKIVFTSGTFYINAAINIPDTSSDLTLEGAGKGDWEQDGATIFRFTHANGTIYAYGSDASTFVRGISISNIKFFDNTAALAVTAIHFRYALNVAVKNCGFNNIVNNSILAEGVYGITIEDCTFQSCGNVAGTKATIELVKYSTMDVTFPIITKCIFEADKYRSISCSSSYLLDGPYIYNNYFEAVNSSPSDAFISGWFYNAHIYDNYMMHSGTTSPAKGVTVLGEANHIFDNYFFQLAYGLYFYDTNNDILVESIHGNTFRDINTWGIYTHGGSGNNFLGNTFVNCGNTSTTGAVFLEWETNCIFANNIILNPNVIGLKYENCSNLSVNTNRIEDWSGGNTMAYGVYESSGNTVISLFNNEITGANTANVYLAATHNRIGSGVIDRVAGVLATQSGWTSAPDNLANATNGSFTTSTGTGVKNTVGAYGLTGSYIKLDMGAVYTVNIMTKLLIGTNLSDIVGAVVEISEDDATYYPLNLNGGCSTSLWLGATTGTAFFSGAGYGRYIRIQAYNGSGSSANLSLAVYEIKAIDQLTY